MNSLKGKGYQQYVKNVGLYIIVNVGGKTIKMS